METTVKSGNAVRASRIAPALYSPRLRLWLPLCLMGLLHWSLAPIAAAAQTPGRPPTRNAADFNMGAYLEQLSAKGKERGYKEFVYKRTPQGELRIYFAMPANWSPDDRRPAVVFFYGGGWGSGNVFSYDEQAEYFAKCGVVAGMADYRVRTRHGVTPDKCVEDACSVVRWVRANCRKLGVAPDRVIAGGGSAGAHIAACTAVPGAPNSKTDDLTISCVPNGLLLCFPVASLVDDIRSAAFKQVLGEEMANTLSPLRQVTKSWPPTVLFFGNTDRLLPNGLALYNKVREQGIACELYLAAGQGHGFVNLAPWNYVSSKYAAAFFMRAGVLPKAPLPDAPPDVLTKYNGEPIEKTYVKTSENPTRQQLKSGGRRRPSGPSPATPPAAPPKGPLPVKPDELPRQEAASPALSISIPAATMADVNNSIFGMMTVNSLENWETHDPRFTKLAADMRVSHFQYPGGSLSYWWHYDPRGVGYCFRKEEYARAASQRHGVSWFMLQSLEGTRQ